MNEYYKQLLKKVTILLVEDEEQLRKKFKSVLEMYVDTVYEASNGEDALEIFKLKSPHIIITDVKMPVMDGLMLTGIIRELDEKVPIVVISAFSEKGMLIDFISLNLVQYLVKPIDFEQLNEVLLKSAQILEKNGMVEFRLNDDTVYSFSKKILIKGSQNKKHVKLAPKETALLELLIQNKTKLVSKELIEDEVYNMEPMSVSALNNLTSKLRKKIGENKILTISGFGFMLVD